MFSIGKKRKDVLLLKLQNKDLSALALNNLCSDLTENSKCKEIGIDLSAVTDYKNEFFEFLTKLAKSFSISVYNISSDSLTLFYLMNYNRFIRLFDNIDDFLSNRNQLVMRNFSICK